MAERRMPIGDYWEWQALGSCVGMDSDMFFHGEKEPRRYRSARVAQAKRVCAGCRVLDECRDFALTYGEHHGVWGGLSEEERRRIIRERRYSDDCTERGGGREARLIRI
ncbi:hypothetical protein NN3_18280 [Nocardia neocaledoniensis NBRC 108232]|uniref:Transcriptional regulator WhiB n=1 Tax=Nocardia neocaledoniensis TaxID=236511 RepID=A0A317N649_9NOCA|nr:WhiB family transcriptional regulator [Nocardia neocaledoniensis]PWV70449.1 WhiB family redox-sensing transcriptional regulator [Nocardia neocaledoniensis]GEM30821.1 hypothetical protein NN3_18280 [Nocardia neocaledoniensis NBRC 108232]